ncbi:MAG: peptidylprolyl isomerase, partial [Nitrospinae bacterium]|nr:peptidylprolyl isomerase [Nitrospinota bacterium]
MKLIKNKITPVFFLFFFYTTNVMAYVDGIAAKVNSDIITMSEVEDELNTYKKRSGITSLNAEKEKELRTQIIERIINVLLIKDEAVKKNIEVSEQEINEAIRNVKDKNNLSEDVFRKMLEGQGIKEDEYREKIKDQLLSSRIVSQEINSKIVISDKESKDYYEKHKEEFKSPKEIEVEHILLLLSPEASENEVESVRKRMVDIQNKIKSGKSFEKLAATYSDDPSKGESGSIGYIKRGATVPQFEEVAFKLKVGEVSDIVRTNFGLHLIKVVNEKPRKQLSFEDAKADVNELLFKEKFNALYDEWVKNIRKDSFIEIS